MWRGPDADRPLSPKGRAQTKRLGRLLASIDFAPDAIVTSARLRARQTAEGIAEAVGRTVDVDERLNDSFRLRQLRAIIADRPGVGRVVLVGHDPDFSSILQQLCGSDAVQMAKGALARIDVDGTPGEGRARLRWLLPPDVLKGGD